jgi:AraC-like DNA-binding protein
LKKPSYGAAVVEGPEEDARGIVAPDVGLTRFTLERFEPSPAVGRFVAWYWRVQWDLTGQPSHTQQVLSHPVVNIVFEVDEARVVGVQTRIGARTLTGADWALGVMFRPGGFSPFWTRSAQELVDRTLLVSEVFGPSGEDLWRAVRRAGPARSHQVVDAFLADRLPRKDHPGETVAALVEGVAADPAMVRVEDLAERAGLSSRQLQRRFADHVGVSPKWVIRRYRLYEAAERAARGTNVVWADLAAELGFSDQAHLTREFTDALGMAPERYARFCRMGAATGPPGRR